MKKLVLILIALLFSTTLHFSQVDEEKSSASDKQFIRVRHEGSLKEFGVISSAVVLGTTNINGSLEGPDGQEVLKISLPGTDVGLFELGSGASAMYMGSGGTWQASEKAVDYGASLIVEIHEYDEYAVGTFNGTLVKMDISSGTWLTLELEDGEFSIPVQRDK
ncbi:MAG: hypothetical protein DRQ13_05810 [Ignavibacteriae bacterium]|nr:MAG: hypothetical protein DRQ13_05810 [Ignavibacteriota bacterium]